MNKVALEAAPVGEATHERKAAVTAVRVAAIRTTPEVEPAAILSAASFTLVNPTFFLGVGGSCVSEHDKRRKVEKGFNNLLNGAAQRSSSTSCWEGVSNVLENLANHVPEHKRIRNILPVFFVAISRH